VKTEWRIVATYRSG